MYVVIYNVCIYVYIVQSLRRDMKKNKDNIDDERLRGKVLCHLNQGMYETKVKTKTYMRNNITQ